MKKIRISKKTKFQIDSLIKTALFIKKEEFRDKKIHGIRLRFKNGFSIVAKLNKKASVTFSLPSEFNKPRESQPMTLGDIAHDLMNFVIHKKKGNVIPSAVEVDGDSDYFGGKGIINFYFPKPDDPKWKGYTPPSDEALQRMQIEVDELYDRLIAEDGEEYRRNISDAIDGLNEKIWKAQRYKYEANADSPKVIADYVDGYERAKPFEFGSYRMEISGMTGGPVMRIPVVENGTTDSIPYPELNISNGNFAQLAEMLKTIGVDGIDDYGAKISIDQLEQVIQSVNNDPDFFELYTREGHDTHEKDENAPGPRMIDFGLNRDQLMSYLGRLQILIDFAKEHNTGDEFITAG